MISKRKHTNSQCLSYRTPHIVSLPLDCHRLKSLIELVKCRNMLSYDNDISDWGQVIGEQFDNSSSKSNLNMCIL